MTATVESESRAARDRYRWVCRDHDRLRVGWWTSQDHARSGATVHNATEHANWTREAAS